MLGEYQRYLRLRTRRRLEIITKSPRSFGYLKNTWSIRLLATYVTTILGMNVSPMQTWRIVRDLGIVSRRPKLTLEHAEDYEKKKKIEIGRASCRERV